VNAKADGNFTAAASPFFNNWKMMDLKFGFGGVSISSMVGMPGAVQYCEKDSTFEGGGIPSSYDARKEWPNCFHEVYDSGNCTASYAIAAATSLSARFCIADADKYSGLKLSPQQVLSCDKKSKGCKGGGVDFVWSYIQRRGLYPEECLPYVGEKGAACKTTCEESKKQKPISHCILSGEKEIKREISSRGPVVVPMRLMDDFLVYKDGIFFPTEDAKAVFDQKGEIIIHAVMITGWGRSKGIPYWLVENSWGKGWGEDGYARIATSAPVLLTHHVVVGHPETEDALARAEKDRIAATERKEQAKKDRAERDARIAAAKKAREEAKLAEQENLDDDLDSVDLDDIDDGAEEKPEEEVEM